MSQAYRMGFEDISRDSPHRLFIQKYILASSGEDDGDSISGAKENLDGVRIQKALLWYCPLVQQEKIDWDKELEKIQDNLKKEGIKWNETSQPFITVKGTAQVKNQKAHGCTIFWPSNDNIRYFTF